MAYHRGAFERVRREEPRRAASLAIGDPLPDEDGPSLEQAERKLSTAKSQHGRLRQLCDVLAQEIGTVVGREAQMRAAWDEAIRAALDLDPGFAAFEEEFLAAGAWKAALEDGYRELTRYLPRRSQYWDRTNPSLPMVNGAVPAEQVKAWVAELRSGKVDAVFPEIG
jgi:hypothetical protein